MSSRPSIAPRPHGPSVPSFAALAVLVFCAEALGCGACLLAEAAPFQWASWGIFAVIAIVAGAMARVLPGRIVADPEPPRREGDDPARQAEAGQRLELALAERVEQQRRMRHDLRGAMSPVLLIADRLLHHADPAVKRSAEILVRTVDRATALLAESTDAVSPPGDP